MALNRRLGTRQIRLFRESVTSSKIMHTATLITFILYILGVILLGIIAYRQTHNLADYMLGGRQLGRIVTALSVGASAMSGWLLLGLPGALYQCHIVPPKNQTYEETHTSQVVVN